MPRVRRRKSTNVYAGREDNFAALKSNTILLERAFKVTVNAPTPGNKFRVVCNHGDLEIESDSMPDTADRDDLIKAIQDGDTEAHMSDVQNDGAHSGPLQTEPIQFKATLNRVARLSTNKRDAKIKEISHGETKKHVVWSWNDNDIWRDIGTSRGLMLVKKMKLKAYRNGRWDLNYDVEGYARRHKWVYKLDALDIDGQVLFTVVTPSILCKPNQRVHEVSSTGRSPEIRNYYDEISMFVRRGAGEYRV